jgi:sugar lactone lactonase YvrE
MDASKRTADKNQQMIYANILMQQQQLDLGVLGKIRYRGGSSGGGADYTNTIGAITQGIITTPLAQQQLILNQFIRSPAVIPPVIPVVYGYLVTTYVTGIISPNGITVDPINNLYTSQSSGIYKIDTNGTPTVFAGITLGAGFTDNVIGTNAQFNNPNDMTFDSLGNLYVSDTNNSKIRKIATNGMVTTFAGSTVGTNNGIGTIAQFNFQRGMTIDSAGNLYVCDYGNHRIRKIEPDGRVTTFAGSTQGSNNGIGTNAQFYIPTDITIDSAGNLYVCDYANHRIRKIGTNASVETFAGSTVGTNNGIGTNAQFSTPHGITTDSAGNLYVCEFGKHIIRKIGTDAMVTTIAGQLTSGSKDGIGTNAQFNSPRGMTIDSAGNLYVCDTNNNRIRKLTLPAI